MPREPDTLTMTTHVVALSGGKDSTAMALRLAEVEPRDYVYVCTPTGNEPPTMFAHWQRLSVLLGTPLTPIVGGTLTGLITAQQALPNWRQRWCTRMLKIAPYAAWLAQHTPAVSYVGLRADEPAREAGDYSDVPDVTRRFPLREWGWTIHEVLQYLDERDVIIPERTDCQLCFFQRLAEWYALWRDDRAAWLEGERLEALTGHTFRSPGRDAWPAALKDLRDQFEHGQIPRGTEGDLFATLKCRVCRS
jgi:3'-phosphoadenosine 5'-phosphosulfate sulfotransferase (PAPS reductase)/FAD synthetase